MGKTEFSDVKLALKNGKPKTSGGFAKFDMEMSIRDFREFGRNIFGERLIFFRLQTLLQTTLLRMSLGLQQLKLPRICRIAV